MSHSSETEVNVAESKETLKWYETIYENVPCICFVLNGDGVILSVNPFGAQQLSCTIQELVGRSLFQFLSLKSAKGLPELLVNCHIFSPQIACGELHKFDKWQTCLSVRVTLQLHRFEDKCPVFFLFAEEISAKQALEAKLKDRDRQIRLITDSLSGKVSYVDSQRRYRFVSKQYGEWSNVSTEEILGQTVDSFMGAESYTKIQKYVEAALAGEAVSYETTWQFGDGSERYLIVRYIPDIDEAGEVLGFFAVIQDMTEIKHTETILQKFNVQLEKQVKERTAQLRQALTFETVLKRITEKVRDTLDENQILQTVVQEVAIGLSCLYCDTSLYDQGKGTATIHCSYQSLVVSTNSSVLYSDYPQLYSQLLQGSCTQFCELVPSLIQSAQESLAILISPILDEQGVLGDLRLCRQQRFGFEASELRLVQQVTSQCAIALRQARLYQSQCIQVAKLEELNQLKDDFLSTVSHELRTPITNMKMAIQMLSLTLIQNKSLIGQDKISNYMQILKDECTREARLINKLLDLQRLESGEKDISPVPIDLEAWLPPLIQPFHERAHQLHQEFHLDICSGLPVLISDVSMVERILTELLNNACKYTPVGEHIILSVCAQVSYIQVEVVNTGIEISAAHLGRIFDKFYRVPHADPWRQSGTGLGLALTQKLVERLGGSIQVESHSGKTSFFIQLPIHPPRAQEAPISKC